METVVIEQEWVTVEGDGWVDRTVLTAIRRPQWTYTNPDKPDDSTAPLPSPEPFEVGDRGNTFSVHSADEAREFIKLLEKVAAAFDKDQENK
jgi:hypothetical protein